VNTDEARKTVIDALHSVAPELAPEDLAPDDDLQEVGGLDSMDFLNFMLGIHEAAGLDVPEHDYPQLMTLATAIEYVATHA
jgi:acyl carrier protein